MPFFGFILNVASGDGDAALALFRSRVNLVNALIRCSKTLARQHFKYGRGQGGFAMVNMADCAHIQVGFCAFKFFRHISSLNGPLSGLLAQTGTPTVFYNYFIKKLPLPDTAGLLQLFLRH